MLSAAKPTDPKAPSAHEKEKPARNAKDAATPKTERDSSAEFIQDLAESGTANELSTVKAAADAAEGAEAKPDKKTDEDEQRRRTDRGKP